MAQISYESWIAKNPQAMGVVTPEVYAQAIDYYGKMPTAKIAPDGKAFWGADVAKKLGLPSGTKLSVMGTSNSRTGAGGQDPIGAVYVPGAVKDAAKRQGYGGMGMGQVVSDYYKNAGVLGAMGSQNVADYNAVMPPVENTAPTRSRTAAMADNALAAGALPATGNQQAVNDFMTWYNNMGPRAEGPLGSELGFPQARLYDTPYGQQALLPGQIGQSFDPNLMRTNPGLFAAQVQTDQLMSGDPLYGPNLHGFVPPWVAASAGLGAANYPGGQWPAAPSLYDENGYPVGATPGGLPPATFYPGSGFGQGNGSGSGTGGANPNPFPPIGGGGNGGGGSTGGGGSNPSLPGTPAPPQYQQGTATAPGSSGALNPEVGTGSFFPSNGPSSASQWLAEGGNDLSYLQGFAQNGQPINQLPGWNAMVDAQQRNIDRRYADLQESFNVSGNRASTPFGQAAVDFQTQAGLEQNALLAQMQQQAMEAAMGRQFGASGQLGQMAHQGIGQLAGQDFQSDMWQMNHAYNLANQMYQGSVGAANQMNAQAAQAAHALAQNAMSAGQGLYGAETSAGLSEADRQMMLQQMGLGAANDLSSLWMQSLGLGSALGQQQYGIQQNEIDRIYQEWLRTRYYNSPTLPYQYGAATGYPATAYPQQGQPSAWPSILGMMAGPLQSILQGLGNNSANSINT